MVARFGVGGVSGSAVAVVLLAGLLLLSVIHASVTGREMGVESCTSKSGWSSAPIVGAVLFGGWAFFTAGALGLVNGVESAQNLLAVTITLGSVVFLWWRATPDLARIALTGSVVAGWILLFLYGIQLAASGLGAQGLISRRSFAIVATILLCAILAQWSALRWPSKVMALGLVVEIALSGSRMALALVVVALAVSAIGRSGRIFRVGLVAVFGAVSFVILANTWPPLRDRFFSGDVSLTIGGVAINAEGRTEIWAYLLALPGVNEVLGHGVGAAQARVIEVTGGVMNQPHNEFIRLFFDYGPIGVMLASFFSISLVAVISVLARRCAPSNQIHVTALGATLVMAGFMLTDNPMVYPWAFMPFAVYVGLALSPTVRGSSSTGVVGLTSPFEKTLRGRARTSHQPTSGV